MKHYRDGIYRDMPEDEYFAIPYVSASALKQLDRSPAHCKQFLTEGIDPTEAMKLGTAAHMALFQPKLFKDYFVIKRLNWSTKDGKDEKAELLKQVNGDESRIIKESDYLKAKAMPDAIAAHCQTVAGLIKSITDVEVVLIFTDERTGLKCKCRVDCLIRNDKLGINALADLKTCQDSRERAFQNDIARMNYNIQDVFYRRAAEALNIGATDIYFIAVESKAPFVPVPYQLKEASRIASEARVTSLLNQFKDCADSENWPGYTDEVTTIELPEWKLNQLEKMGADMEAAEQQEIENFYGEQYE